jgi:hypothetical protein
MPEVYFTDTKSKVVFAADGPKPQFLFDTPQFKTLVVGLAYVLTFYLIAQQYNLLIYLSLPSTRRMLEAWNARE